MAALTAFGLGLLGGCSGEEYTYGFSSWYMTGSVILQLNYGDGRLGSHVVSGGSSGDGGCSSNGGCHSQVWVR